MTKLNVKQVQQEKGITAQAAHAMKEKMLATITQHPNQATYTFQVHHDDLSIASLVGAALCLERLIPIVVVEEPEEKHEQREPLFS